jgi:hypothetical protein
VPSMEERFQDLAVITRACDCYRADKTFILYDTPCLAKYRILYNYPRLWVLLSRIGVTYQHQEFYGTVLAVLLLLAVLTAFSRLTAIEALLVGFVVCSPSVMLLVERGNTDIVIFVLLYIAARLLHSTPRLARWCTFLLVMLAAALKLYPILALSYTLRETPRRRLLSLIVGVVIFSVYLGLTSADLAHIQANTPRSLTNSYGSEVVYKTVIDVLNPTGRMRTTEFHNAISRRIATVIRKAPMVDVQRLPGLERVFRTAHFLALGASAVLLVLHCWRRQKAMPSMASDLLPGGGGGFPLDLFRMGAGIFIGTFALLINWNYRLVFLVMTMPQLISWGESPHKRLRRAARLGLCAILVTTWMSRFPFYLTLFVDEIANWYLFYFFLATLTCTINRGTADEESLKLHPSVSKVAMA